MRKCSLSKVKNNSARSKSGHLEQHFNQIFKKSKVLEATVGMVVWTLFPNHFSSKSFTYKHSLPEPTSHLSTLALTLPSFTFLHYLAFSFLHHINTLLCQLNTHSLICSFCQPYILYLRSGKWNIIKSVYPKSTIMINLKYFS